MNKYARAFAIIMISSFSHSIAANICIFSKFNKIPTKQSINIPESLISDSTDKDTKSSITALSKSLDNKIEALKQNQDNNSPFYGLYITGRAAQRDSDDQNRLGLEWQVFRRGYFEGQRKADLNSTNNLIKSYTLQDRLRQQSLNQAIYHTRQVQNNLLVYYYRELLSQQTQLTEIYKKRLPSGYATRQELSQEETRRKIFQSKLKYYERNALAMIPEKMANLINNIEHVKLSPLPELQKLATARSGLEELQELHKRQAELSSPRWSDNLNLSLYTQKYQDYNGSEGTETGVQVDIPIGGNLHFNSDVKYRSHLANLQLSASKAQLLEQLASLTEQFYFVVEEVEQLKNEYKLLLSNTDIYCKQSRHVIPSLEETPEKLLEKMPIKLLAAQRDIQLSRTRAYQLLLKIESMVQPHQGEQWYSIE
jgi:hypothetical protein